MKEEENPRIEELRLKYLNLKEFYIDAYNDGYGNGYRNAAKNYDKKLDKLLRIKKIIMDEND